MICLSPIGSYCYWLFDDNKVMMCCNGMQSVDKVDVIVDDIDRIDKIKCKKSRRISLLHFNSIVL